MTAKKKADPARYRVARAFKHDGRLITNASTLEGAKLSAAALEDRVKRGYIEDRLPAAPDTAPAAKAKE